MTHSRAKQITNSVWDKYADLYELGMMSAKEIARELGVSPATVSRHLKIRGCIKGSRVKETVADLEAFLERKRTRAYRIEKAQEANRQKNREKTDQFVELLVNTIIAADRAGKLAELGPTIKKINRSLGAR